jgi:hypothetical protein
LHLLFQKAPTVSVPHVYNAYKIDEEYTPGATLRKCWGRLPEVEKELVKKQLRRHVVCWRRIRGEFFGAIEGGPRKHSIFKHAYGPL